MKENIALFGAAVAIVIAAFALMQTPAAPAPVQNFGGTTNYDSIALTKVGTSTLSNVGCFNGFASSTATPIKFVYLVSATSTLSGAAPGIVAWQFGQCTSNPGL